MYNNKFHKYKLNIYQYYNLLVYIFIIITLQYAAVYWMIHQAYLFPVFNLKIQLFKFRLLEF